MKMRKDERKLLILTYILCIGLFSNLAILSDPIDKKALIIGGALCLVIGYSHFVIRRFYPDGDKFLLIFAGILSVIGIAMLYRLETSLAIKQIVWFIVGIIVYILTVVIVPNIRSFAKYKTIYLVATLIFAPMALLLGKELNGAKNWVFLGQFGFQPSEFGKIFLVIYLASVLKDFDNTKKGFEHIKQLIQPAIVVMIFLGCLVLQRDLGSALIFFGISVSVLYIATSKKKYAFTCLGLFALGSSIAYKLFPHVRTRVDIWRNPWADPNGYGYYQVTQGLYSISSGGMLGSGLGQGYPGFVPVKESDYIFAAICEEFGIIFGIGILIIFFLLFYRAIRIAFVTDDKFSQLVAVGFSIMIACQALVIVGGIFAVIPLTGITLPFVSYGGSSMVTMFFTLGLLQKVSEEG